MIASLFVPLAIVNGKPNQLNTDKEMIVAPPARVLINPTNKPEIISIMYISILIIILVRKRIIFF
ncbi:MAG: hypothetical protein BWX61_00964 [Bacteroidetes bacterium ADurb.Bin035]|nr:MAG: hypothetical protein BWX61_00964 [Bacteroidetes bacterium ADurb.Bin035]